MQTGVSAARLRQILLRLSKKNISEREIAKDIQMGRNQLRALRKVLKTIPLTYQELLALEDTKILELIEKAKYEMEINKNNDVPGVIDDEQRQAVILEQIEFYKEELKRPGVNKFVLHSEYKKTVENPYSYSFFCRLIKRNLNKKNPTYHRTYNPGEYLFIDFAGDQMQYVDPDTGEIFKTYTLVITFAYSNYTYVEVLPNASTGELIKGLNNGLDYFGGIPSIALSDNMKQWVIKPDKYEPVFSTAIDQWANHNGIILQAARVRSPRDKSAVENHVKITYSKIQAPLRNRIFHSTVDINMAIRNLLRTLNTDNFQSRTYSRYEKFMCDEQPLLGPLPETKFTLRHYATATVQESYHISLSEDKHYYSVPYELIGEKVEIIYDTQTVEIFYKLHRKSTHIRNYSPGKYTTIKDHMPEAHVYADKMFYENGAKLLDRAKTYGENVFLYAEKLLLSRKNETHGYKSIQGILSLGSNKKYGEQLLNDACAAGIQLNEYSYQIINEILKNKHSVVNSNKKVEEPQFMTHENLRGIEEFKNKFI